MSLSKNEGIGKYHIIDPPLKVLFWLEQIEKAISNIGLQAAKATAEAEDKAILGE